MSKIQPWKVLNSRIVFSHNWYKVRRDTVEIKPKKSINYFLGVFPDAVYIVALTKENKILLVRQYKHGAGKILLEVPAGYIHKGEQPLHAAKRELLEETGYSTNTWKKLGFFYSNPTKEKGNGIYIFLARDVWKIKKQKLDRLENIELCFFEEGETMKKILRNEIEVTGSALALLLAFDKSKSPAR